MYNSQKEMLWDWVCDSICTHMPMPGMLFRCSIFAEINPHMYERYVESVPPIATRGLQCNGSRDEGWNKILIKMKWSEDFVKWTNTNWNYKLYTRDFMFLYYIFDVYISEDNTCTYVHIPILYVHTYIYELFVFMVNIFTWTYTELFQK